MMKQCLKIQANITDDNSKLTEVKTRFGNILINTEKKINFPNGILGFEETFNYCLANYPEDKLPSFKILQSVENGEIAFLVLPIIENNIYADEDLDKSLGELQIKREDAVIILITTIYNNIPLKKSTVTVNLRAPLLVDSQNLLGYQYVFNNEKYSIQHEIN